MLRILNLFFGKIINQDIFTIIVKLSSCKLGINFEPCQIYYVLVHHDPPRWISRGFLFPKGIIMSPSFGKWEISHSWKMNHTQWIVNFGNCQQCMETFVDDIVEWLPLWFANKECQKYKWDQLVHGEFSQFKKKKKSQFFISS